MANRLRCQAIARARRAGDFDSLEEKEDKQRLLLQVRELLGTKTLSAASNQPWGDRGWGGVGWG